MCVFCTGVPAAIAIATAAARASAEDAKNAAKAAAAAGAIAAANHAMDAYTHAFDSAAVRPTAYVDLPACILLGKSAITLSMLSVLCSKHDTACLLDKLSTD